MNFDSKSQQSLFHINLKPPKISLNLLNTQLVSCYKIISIDSNLVCQHGLIRIVSDEIWVAQGISSWATFIPRSLFPILKGVLRGLFDSWCETNQYFQLSPLHKFFVPYIQRRYHLLSELYVKVKDYCTIGSASYYSQICSHL